MNITPAARDKYASVVIALHWLVLVLIVSAYATMEFREIFERGTPERTLMRSAHYLLGLTILFVAVGRILAHIVTPTPPIQPTPPLWQALAAKAVHVALFALMIGLPILGWLILSAEGKPPSYFGLQLPALLSPDKAFAEQLEDLHEIIARLGYGLIGLHAAAALYHHYIVHDNTLVRMLPGRSGA